MADDPASSSGPPDRPFFALAPLLRGVGIASDARKLILAAVGLLALTYGWKILAPSGAEPGPYRPGVELWWEWRNPSHAVLYLAEWVSEPALVLVAPFVGLFNRGGGPTDWFRSALMALWGVLVWGLVGGAIARIAVVQAACGRRVGLGAAIRFAARKSASLVGAPLIPFLAVSLLVASCAGFGLLYRIPGGIGETVAAALWFLPLLAGLVAALILAGLALGWPLMHATIAAEDEDAADALSRSYSYINQRLMRYLMHAGAACALGIVGLVLAHTLGRMVVGVSGWGVSLGSPGGSEPARSIPAGWLNLVGLFVHGWIYSYFWTSASIIYLILRRDVDGTEWEDVALPEHAADTFAGPAGGPAPQAEA